MNGERYEVIYRSGEPYGIRDSGGYVLFFPKITKYDEQEERYKDELGTQIGMAEFLTEQLNRKEIRSKL